MVIQGKTGWTRTKAIPWVLAAGLVMMAAIQFVPYGRDHSVVAPPHPFQWKSPEAEALARTACYDCHSNETRWWWAVNVAPMSWLAQHDINDAKRRVNFSDWTAKPMSAKLLDRALHRNMPPLQFTLVHPDARLTEAQKQTLIQGFKASLPNPGAAETAGVAGQTPESLLLARCTSCHSAGKAQRYRTPSSAQAKALIESMVRKGAEVSPVETKTLISYFTR